MRIVPNRSLHRRIGPVSVLVQAGLLAWCLTGPSTAHAQSSLHGGIELGAKGIKAIVIEVMPGKEGPGIKVVYSADANTTLAELKDGQFKPNAINTTGEKVDQFYKSMENDFKVPTANIHIVASSGLPNPPNFAALRDVIKKKTGKELPPPIDANTEVALSIKHAVKPEERDNSILVDVGSGNTKGGYLEIGAARGMPRAAAFSIPLGSVSFMAQVEATKEGKDNFAETVAKLCEQAVTKPLTDAVAKDPEFSKRRAIYLLGGATWAMVTLLKPETIGKPYVSISADDIDNYHKLLLANPGGYPPVDLDRIKNEKDRDRVEKDVRRVGKTFSPEGLLAGCEILRALSRVLRFKEKQLVFPRLGYLAWIGAYVEGRIAPVVPETNRPGYWGHPHISKRGDEEKSVAEKLASTIVANARTSVKNGTLKSFERKLPKPGRVEYHIKAGYVGAVIGTKYTAEIVVHLDTSEKYNWEVLRIDYSDNNKSLVGFNRKNLEKLRATLNGD
jgi:hypothetical protein